MEEKMTARKRKFTEKDLASIREKTMKPYWLESPLECFWKEIEEVLNTTEKPARWEKLKGKDIHGDVWQQVIGEYMHNHTVHRFAWMYVESTGEVIGLHGHEEPVNKASEKSAKKRKQTKKCKRKQTKKFKEWYIFPDGTKAVCSKGEMHRLVNSFGEPIYVLSIKVGSNSTRI